MQVRKEHVVLVGTLVVLGWLLRGVGSSTREPRGGGRGGARPEFVEHPAPAVDRALPPEGGERGRRELARELFSPPRDTRPLPPLELEAPPTPPLAALRPPPSPGPAPAVYGRFLRVPPQSFAAPALFEEVEAEDVAIEDVDEAAGGGARAAEEKLGAAEFAERVEGWTKVYDWVRVGSLKLGRIVNEDRFALLRDARPIRFVEFDPVTGRERFGGQAIAYERERVEEFGFADTVPNRIELERLAFGDPLTAGEYESALAFAERCIAARLESPRALVVAEEMFRRASAIAKDDPSPRIGLARVHEAAFDFEAAFGIYHELAGGAHARDARVLVPLALLERRMRMFERAEARLLEAERYARTSWQVQAALVRHLLEDGRHAEAVQHLRLANQYEPAGAEHKRDRARLRTDLGRALLATGELEEAEAWMRKALSADAEEALATAGLVAIAVTAGRPSAGGDVVAPESAGFEWLVANGLARIAARDFAGAKQDLALAARVDPLRAAVAWRALSWLAEITGYPEEALRYVELALENDPTDVWALIQHGRVLAARDDLEGALEAYRAALGLELELADALAAMGEIEHRRGAFADAERYFERALALDPGMTPAHDLRGINLLELGSTQAAEASFRAALAARPDEPTALCGLAWCLYRSGDAQEAVIAFRELDDTRRDQPEDDPWRTYARAQIERLTDHLEKVSWTDRFERRSLRNNWGVEETAGPTVTIVDGAVRIAGAFKSAGRSRLWQVKAAGDFVAFQARVTVRPSSTARAGILVTRERSRRGESTVEAEVSISRHPLEGVPQLHFVGRGDNEAPYENAPGFDWPAGEPVTLRIERVGDANDGTLRILLDGFPVAEETLPTLGRTTTELRVGAFVEGETGREADVLIDDVEIVYRER